MNIFTATNIRIPIPRTAFKVFAGGMLSLAFAIPAVAHHGWSGNGEEEFELTGTVEKTVSLDGPHATMKLKVGEQVWDVTLAPPARTERAGLKENTIPVGAKVTISGHRTYNGKLYNVYPDRT